MALTCDCGRTTALRWRNGVIERMNWAALIGGTA